MVRAGCSKLAMLHIARRIAKQSFATSGQHSRNLVNGYFWVLSLRNHKIDTCGQTSQSLFDLRVCHFWETNTQTIESDNYEPANLSLDRPRHTQPLRYYCGTWTTSPRIHTTSYFQPNTEYWTPDTFLRNSKVG